MAVASVRASSSGHRDKPVRWDATPSPLQPTWTLSISWGHVRFELPFVMLVRPGELVIPSSRVKEGYQRSSAWIEHTALKWRALGTAALDDQGCAMATCASGFVFRNGVGASAG